MKKPSSLLFIFIAFIMVLAACSNEQTSTSETDGEATKDETVQGEKVINYAIPSDPKTLDPHFMNSLANYAIVQNTFNALVRFPPGNADVSKIEGDLAESWESSEDAKQWTFHLRQGVQWHKGYGEVTAEDVKASFDRVMDPTSGITSGYKFSKVEKIEAPDNYTVIFHLADSDPLFLTKVIDFSGGYIVNIEAIEAGETVGTGPFVVEEYKTQDKVVAVKNTEFFRGEPKIDKVVYKVMTDPTAVDMAMDKGEIHLAHGSPDPIWVAERSKNPDLILESPMPASLGSIYLNVTQEPFDDIKVRKAIAHAIDVTSYAAGMIAPENGGVPSGPIPLDVAGAIDVKAYEYDIEKAKELLKEAGYEDGLTLPKQYVSPHRSVSEPVIFIQDQLKEIGIELPLEQVDDTTYRQNAIKGMNSVTYNAFNRIPHISIWLQEVFYGPSAVGTPTGVINFSHYSKSDDLIKQALVETDQDKANQLYEQIQKQIRDEYVSIPLMEYRVPEVRRKEVVLGYNNNKHEGTIHYYIKVTEATDLVQ